MPVNKKSVPKKNNTRKSKNKYLAKKNQKRLLKKIKKINQRVIERKLNQF